MSLLNSINIGRLLVAIIFNINNEYLRALGVYSIPSKVDLICLLLFSGQKIRAHSIY